MHSRWLPIIGGSLLVGLLGACAGGQTGDVGDAAGDRCACEVDTTRAAVELSLADVTESQEPAWNALVEVLGSPTGFSGDLSVFAPPELWVQRGLTAPTSEGNTAVHLTIIPTKARRYSMRETSGSECSIDVLPCAERRELDVDMTASLRLNEFEEVYAGEGVGVVRTDSVPRVSLTFAEFAADCSFFRTSSGEADFGCLLDDGQSIATWR